MFVLWPLVFVVVALIARRTRLRAMPLLIAAFGVIFVRSLIFSIVETSTHQSFAYFDTRTRLWEFAAGSLLALLLPRFAASSSVRAAVGWAGHSRDRFVRRRARRAGRIPGIPGAVARAEHGGRRPQRRGSEHLGTGLDSGLATVAPARASLLPDAADVPADVPLWPDATTVDEEWVSLDGSCRDTYAPSDPLVAESCSERRSEGWVRDLVVIVGDSHAQQWAGAVLPVAEDQGWDVAALLKGGCSFAVDEPPVDGIDDCAQWREQVIAFLDELRPSIVFGMATKSVAESADEHALAGIEATVDRLSGSGASVILFRDNPRFDQNMFFCVDTAGPEAPECRRPLDAVVAPANPAQGVRGADVIDLLDYLCPDSWCLPAIGNVVVYLDHNHLTQSYARTLGPVLAAELASTGALG